MLFRRRIPPTLVERTRVALWPRRSWSRSLRYFGKRVLRLAGSPHTIAAGFAAGVLVSWTPFLGFHIILGMVLAFVLGGNILAAVLGTIVGNPLTFPFIWLSTYVLGSRILETEPDIGRIEMLQANLAGHPVDSLLGILKPMLIGAVPLGLLSAAVAYAIVAFVVRAYQSRRRQRLAARRLASAPSALVG